MLLSILSKYSYLKPFFNYTRKGLWKGTSIHQNWNTLMCFHPIFHINTWQVQKISHLCISNIYIYRAIFTFWSPLILHIYIFLWFFHEFFWYFTILEIYDDANKLYQDITKLKNNQEWIQGFENFTATLLLVYFSFFQFYSSSSSSYEFPCRFALTNEKFDNNSTSGGISILFCKKNGTMLHSYLPKHIWWDFRLSNVLSSLPLKYSIFSLVVY